MSSILITGLDSKKGHGRIIAQQHKRPLRDRTLFIVPDNDAGVRSVVLHDGIEKLGNVCEEDREYFFHMLYGNRIRPDRVLIVSPYVRRGHNIQAILEHSTSLRVTAHRLVNKQMAFNFARHKLIEYEDLERND